MDDISTAFDCCFPSVVFVQIRISKSQSTLRIQLPMHSLADEHLLCGISQGRSDIISAAKQFDDAGAGYIASPSCNKNGGGHGCNLMQYG